MDNFIQQEFEKILTHAFQTFTPIELTENPSEDNIKYHAFLLKKLTFKPIFPFCNPNFVKFLPFINTIILIDSIPDKHLLLIGKNGRLLLKPIYYRYLDDRIKLSRELGFIFEDESYRLLKFP